MQEQRKCFQKWRIISYTMSNTESWARANPPTKRLKATSPKEFFNVSRSGRTLPSLPSKSQCFVFWECTLNFLGDVGFDHFHCKCVCFSFYSDSEVINWSTQLCMLQCDFCKKRFIKVKLEKCKSVFAVFFRSAPGRSLFVESIVLCV